MCGISGIVDLRESRPINAGLLRAMNDALTHRGPDGEGFHIEPGVGLGHRRLSIIDLEGGKQPLYNEDHTVVVTFNGEIFNFKEIESELVARGHVFRTRSDTEVIVHAWEEWGTDCLHRFNGMFAFAIWDQKNKTLFMARDRLGVKPLYYSVLADGHVVFGSELKALLVHPGIQRRLDPRAVEEYMAFGYVPDPKTIFKDVLKLEPGFYVLGHAGRGLARPVRYWDVPLFAGGARGGGFDQWQEQLRAQLQEAVRKRLVSDVPLGAFLSGGIDSSAVVAMMREIGTEHLKTCSIGFREPRYDESEYASLVVRQKNTDHTCDIVEASDYGLLDELVRVYDEPYADSSAIPTYRVCELARRHVTVALSGDGGDENFIGYRRYRLFAMEEGFRQKLPFPIRRAVFGTLGEIYPKLDWAPRFLRGKTTFQALARDSADAYFHSVSFCASETRNALYTSAFKNELDGYRANEVFRSHLEGKSFDDSLAMVQYLDFKTYLPGDILTKVDRASMAHSLEVRTPFLDYEFVEWAAGIPSDAKLRGGEGKLILKRSLEKLLPREVLYRKKMGFGVPLDMWFRDSLKSHIADTVNGERLRDSEIFDPSMLGRLVADHQSGRRDYSAALWSLLMFDGFLKNNDQGVESWTGGAVSEGAPESKFSRA